MWSVGEAKLPPMILVNVVLLQTLYHAKHSGGVSNPCKLPTKTVFWGSTFENKRDFMAQARTTFVGHHTIGAVTNNVCQKLLR